LEEGVNESEKRIFAEYDIANDSYNFWLVEVEIGLAFNRRDLGEPLFTLSHDASYAMMSHLLDIGIRPRGEGRIVEDRHRAALTMARAWAVEQAAKSGSNDVGRTTENILAHVLEGKRW
jgi:hypothetical protein